VRKRSLIIIAVVVVLVVTGVTVGLVEARAQGEPRLAATTPARLLADMAQHAGDATVISGGVTWKNDVLGFSMLSFGNRGPGDLTALLSSGRGRVWVQDGKARLEIQGSLGDTTIVGDPTGMWVYTSASNTATEYALPADRKPDRAEQGGGTASQPAVADPVQAIDDFIQKLAPAAALAVSEQVTVAGQSCYVLSLTPRATNTVFGSVKVAIDGTTYLPLKVDIYAKGVTEPVFTAGFTSVSYARAADDIFAFTPPPTAKVEHKMLTLPAALTERMDVDPSLGPDAAEGPMPVSPGHTPLTLAEAAVEAGFTPLTAQTDDPALAFGDAYVVPARELDLGSLLGRSGLGALGSAGPDADAPDPDALGPDFSGPITLGPGVVQRYGEGFGTVMLVQVKAPAEVIAYLDLTLSAFPLLGRTTTGGKDLYQFNTSLGSAALWNDNGLLFAAAGSVSQTDLMEFIADVR